MKKIISKKTGYPLTIEEACIAALQLRRIGITVIDERSVYGYPNQQLAEKATLRQKIETYEGWTFLFAGSCKYGFEGYKARIIAVKNLPQQFEDTFPNYVVVGK